MDRLAIVFLLSHPLRDSFCKPVFWCRNLVHDTELTRKVRKCSVCAGPMTTV